MRLAPTFLAAAIATFAPRFAAADAHALTPRSAGDTWAQGQTDEQGQPLLHSLREHALDLAERGQFRWRVGISWKFAHPQSNGMPGAEDRKPMMAVDDVVFSDFERNDDCRIVYFTTGGGIREVMLYARSEAAAWAHVDALFKRFPQIFPGKRGQWAYVKQDADWAEFRAVAAALTR